MLSVRSAGASVSPAAAMLMNTRVGVREASNSVFGGGKGSFAVAFGGLSEGHRKTKSTRACAPGRRCAATRIAAGGSWNATPATVTGSGGHRPAAQGGQATAHSRYRRTRQTPARQEHQEGARNVGRRGGATGANADRALGQIEGSASWGEVDCRITGQVSVIGNPASLCPNTCLAFARHEAGVLKINPFLWFARRTLRAISLTAMSDLDWGSFLLHCYLKQTR